MSETNKMLEDGEMETQVIILADGKKLEPQGLSGVGKPIETAET